MEYLWSLWIKDLVMYSSHIVVFSCLVQIFFCQLSLSFILLRVAALNKGQCLQEEIMCGCVIRTTTPYKKKRDRIPGDHETPFNPEPVITILCDFGPRFQTSFIETSAELILFQWNCISLVFQVYCLHFKIPILYKYDGAEATCMLYTSVS